MTRKLIKEIGNVLTSGYLNNNKVFTILSLLVANGNANADMTMEEIDRVLREHFTIKN
jgi:hypothetical protein|tara:strand:- start:2393 stop:2566 length:174 start_codon:yes stop_codon:yes gene_type:complete